MALTTFDLGISPGRIVTHWRKAVSKSSLTKLLARKLRETKAGSAKVGLSPRDHHCQIAQALALRGLFFVPRKSRGTP